MSPLVPLLILGFPVLDTLSVMAQRFAERRPLFSADRNHFHHRLMGLGFDHSESVFAIYVLQSLLVIGAYFFRFYPEWLILTIYIVLSAAILCGFHVADKTHWRLGRYDFLEHLIKGRVKRMRDEGVFIRGSFRAIRFGLPPCSLSPVSRRRGYRFTSAFSLSPFLAFSVVSGFSKARGCGQASCCRSISSSPWLFT